MGKRKIYLLEEGYHGNKNNWTEWDFKLAYYYTARYRRHAALQGFTIFKRKKHMVRPSTPYMKDNYYIRKVSRYYNVQIQMLPRKTEEGKKIAEAFKKSYFHTVRGVLNSLNKDLKERFKECNPISTCPTSMAPEDNNNTIIIRFVETQPPPETNDEIYGKLQFINLATNEVLREDDFHYVPSCIPVQRILLFTKQPLIEMGYTEEQIEDLKIKAKEIEEFDMKIRRRMITSPEAKKRLKQLKEETCIKVPEKIYKKYFNIYPTLETDSTRQEYVTVPEKVIYAIYLEVLRNATSNYIEKLFFTGLKNTYSLDPIQPGRAILREKTKEWFKRHGLKERILPKDLIQEITKEE